MPWSSYPASFDKGRALPLPPQGGRRYAGKGSDGPREVSPRHGRSSTRYVLPSINSVRCGVPTGRWGWHSTSTSSRPRVSAVSVTNWNSQSLPRCHQAERTGSARVCQRTVLRRSWCREYRLVPEILVGAAQARTSPPQTVTSGFTRPRSRTLPTRVIASFPLAALEEGYPWGVSARRSGSLSVAHETPKQSI